MAKRRTRAFTESESESEAYHSESSGDYKPKRKRSSNGKRTSQDKSKKEANLPDPVIPMPELPRLVMERIFKNLSRDDLDRCQRVCRSWYHVIENAGKQLSQRRIITIKLAKGQWKDALEVSDLKGKICRIDQDFVRAKPNFRVFKNAIIPVMRDDINTSTLKIDRYKTIYMLAGSRIPIERHYLNVTAGYNLSNWMCLFEHLFESSTVFLRLDPKAFNYSMNGEYLNFGPDVAVHANIVVDKNNGEWWYNHESLHQMEKFRQLCGCEKVKNPDLVSLLINIHRDLLENHFDCVISSFVESPNPKFFKLLKLVAFDPLQVDDALTRTVASLPSRQNFKLVEEIVNDTTAKRVYRLKHPTQKCILKLVIDRFEMEFNIEKF